MPIHFSEEKRTFRLDTKTSSYFIHIDERGFLLHQYYGKRLREDDLSHISRQGGRDSHYPWPAGSTGYGFALDAARLEIPCFGTGDFRSSALMIRENSGHASTDLRYASHRIYRGKPTLPGLPATYATEDEAQTLELVTTDAHSGAEVTLLYTVFENEGAMTRSLRVENKSDVPLRIERIFSASVDFIGGDYDFITNHGRWGNECTIDRAPIHHGVQSVGSRRGASGPSHNPFCYLTEHNTTEQYGQAWGFCFVYSGNFLAEAELDSQDITRFLMGIHPDDFSWKLEPGESFVSPEVVMTYSSTGIGDASRTFGRLFREHLVRGEWKTKKRPLLINSWEGVYFSFDADRLVDLAQRASKLGIELFVMDDGWFGQRYSDRAGLGDWYVNEEKLKSTLGDMVERIKATGMKFGIWFEPEMVSHDSDLFRAHPDWAIQVPGRGMSISRYQYVLDMTREDVRDYLFDSICAVMDSADITYIKWDYNRAITEAGSALLPPERQSEFFHRYILGLYSLYERLLARYPHLLLEGCASGGARFDAGILYYAPQSWASDDTDAIERINIQYGLSFCYPASSVGAHVSECPNHTTRRTTPTSTRGALAMSGTGGYELDLVRMTEADQEIVRGQVADYHKYYDLTHYGDQYRLISPLEGARKQAAWMFVSPDKREALVNFVVIRTEIQVDRYFRLDGLDPDLRYRIEGTDEVYYGQTLMSAGLEIIGGMVDGQCKQYHLIAE